MNIDALDPDDEQALLVYADWLTQHGDPRGELIAVQHARLAQPANTHLEYEERRILRAHREVLVPDVPGTLTWERGWIRGAVARDAGLRPLLEHPSSRFLRDLVVTTGDYRDVLFTLATHAPPLARLAIRDRARTYFEPEPAPTHVLAFPRLVHFAFDGVAFDVGTFDIPQVETLLLRANACEHETARVLCSASLERLVALEVWFDSELLEPLFARADLPSLRFVRFGLASPSLPRMLADSPLTETLETISLRENFAGDDLLLAELRLMYGGRLRTDGPVLPFAPWLPSGK